MDEKMKEVIKEIENSKELQEELQNVKDKEAMEAFLKKHDCGVSVKEMADYIRSQAKNREGEIGDDEVAAVAGGEGEFICLVHWLTQIF